MILGIDPGKNGALCFYRGGLDVKFYKMPEIFHIADLTRAFQEEGKPNRVYIEKAQSMPSQGVKSMFEYGKHTGWLLGVLQSLNIPTVEVPPQTWCKEIHKGVTQHKGAGSGKKKSLEASAKLFPGVDFRASDRSVKLHDGYIDAALIAKYAWDKYGGK